ncbi:unnamed protein product, partial [Nesidiocoris tenuis]
MNYCHTVRGLSDFEMVAIILQTVTPPRSTLFRRTAIDCKCTIGVTITAGSANGGHLIDIGVNPS